MLLIFRIAKPGNIDWNNSDDIDRDRKTLLEVLNSNRKMLAWTSLRLLEKHPDKAGTAAIVRKVSPY